MTSIFCISKNSTKNCLCSPVVFDWKCSLVIDDGHALYTYMLATIWLYHFGKEMVISVDLTSWSEPKPPHLPAGLSTLQSAGDQNRNILIFLQGYDAAVSWRSESKHPHLLAGLLMVQSAGDQNWNLLIFLQGYWCCSQLPIRIETSSSSCRVIDAAVSWQSESKHPHPPAGITYWRCSQLPIRIETSSSSCRVIDAAVSWRSESKHPHLPAGLLTLQSAGGLHHLGSWESDCKLPLANPPLCLHLECRLVPMNHLLLWRLDCMYIRIEWSSLFLVWFHSDCTPALRCQHFYQMSTNCQKLKSCHKHI